MKLKCPHCGELQEIEKPSFWRGIFYWLINYDWRYYEPKEKCTGYNAAKHSAMY